MIDTNVATMLLNGICLSGQCQKLENPMKNPVILYMYKRYAADFIVTDRYTHTVRQNKYHNPVAHALRVKVRPVVS